MARRTARSLPAGLLLGLGLFLYFSVWAFLKPPLQSPDEGQHLVRALAVPSYPWLAPGARLPIAADALSPLALTPAPEPLARLFNRRDLHLDARGVRELKALEWSGARQASAPVPVLSQAWSYPPLYHAGVFALGQGVTRLLALGPYASLFAFRLASVALAAPLWVWVWRRLGQAEGLRPWRAVIFLSITANPMLAFLTASVNPDAVFAPLGALALLAAVELLESRTRVPTALVIVLLALLAKPTGLLLVAAIMATAAGARFVLGWRPPHTLSTLAVLAMAAAVAVAGFYAWSPARTYAATIQAGPDAVGAVRWLWRVWKSYWGTPGYLDYWLSNGWYVGLTAIWLANGLLALWGWRHEHESTRRASRTAAAAAVVFAAGVIGGSLASIPGLEFNVQGRYLLPVGLGIAAVGVHRWPSAAWGFVAFLATFHLALAHESVVRYFGGDYRLLLQSLPWT